MEGFILVYIKKVIFLSLGKLCQSYSTQPSTGDQEYSCIYFYFLCIFQDICLLNENFHVNFLSVLKCLHKSYAYDFIICLQLVMVFALYNFSIVISLWWLFVYSCSQLCLTMSRAVNLVCLCGTWGELPNYRVSAGILNLSSFGM